MGNEVYACLSIGCRFLLFKSRATFAWTVATYQRSWVWFYVRRVRKLLGSLVGLEAAMTVAMFARLARLFDTSGEFSDFAWVRLRWGRVGSQRPTPRACRLEYSTVLFASSTLFLSAFVHGGGTSRCLRLA